MHYITLTLYIIYLQALNDRSIRSTRINYQPYYSTICLQYSTDPVRQQTQQEQA
jgi:hypothetical protein